MRTLRTIREAARLVGEGAERFPTAAMLRAYEDGIRCRKLYRTEREAAEKEIYGNGPLADIVERPIAYAFWQAGFEGEDMPRWVTGWRYGDPPRGGQSHNFRDNAQERGVSLMGVDGMPERGTASYRMFNSAGKKKVRVAGWLLPQRGSDGEYLLVGVEKI